MTDLAPAAEPWWYLTAPSGPDRPSLTMWRSRRTAILMALAEASAMADRQGSELDSDEILAAVQHAVEGTDAVALVLSNGDSSLVFSVSSNQEYRRWMILGAPNRGEVSIISLREKGDT